MSTQLTEVNSVLGIEIGSVLTRAVLFDVVEESYQFIAAGSAATTDGAPHFDVSTGVLEALEQLQQITGKYLLDLNKKLIIPSHGGIEGVDKLVVTLSCGADLHAATFGLLSDLSLASADKLARCFPLNIADGFGINDRRPLQKQIDALQIARPDLLIFAGGADRGATKSIQRMAAMIASALQLMPENNRPAILYCGNHAIKKKVKESLDKYTSVLITNNILPEIDSEDLTQASFDLNQMIVTKKIKTLNGLEQLASVCNHQPLMTGLGFQHVIKYLGRLYDPARGVLGIDMGSSHTIAAYSNRQNSTLRTLPLGTGLGLENLLSRTKVDEIQKWIGDEISDEYIMEYLWQKTLFPHSQPVTVIDHQIELALIRQILSLTIHDLVSSAALPTVNFEPIIISGSPLTQAAAPWQVLLALLDGIQPLGITPLVVDKHGIMSLLGAAARVNPLLPVQVLESTAFINLATVITLESKARFGSLLLEGKLQSQTGGRQDFEVRQGHLLSLPLPFGETGVLHLKAQKNLQISDVELNGEAIKVKGGVCGLVFDARGRPLRLPDNPALRRELLKTWMDFPNTH